MLETAVALLAAYLLGGLPWGLLLGHWLRGVDIREYGSGRTGATNAARTLGWRISLAVFVLDALKGSLAILLARQLTGLPLVEALAGVAAIAGHCWPPYIGFRGGRGVATGLGGALTLAPWSILVIVPLGLLIVGLTRYVSLASIAGALGVPLALALGSLLGVSRAEYAVYGLLGAAIIILMHGDNIRRLLAGTERKLGERVAVGGAGKMHDA